MLRFNFTGLQNSEGDFFTTTFFSGVSDLVAAARIEQSGEATVHIGGRDVTIRKSLPMCCVVSKARCWHRLIYEINSTERNH